MSAANLADNFIPKLYTQQIQFLKRYPEYDGRKILIAILDTGIDVSLEGLQSTSEGLPKIIDCFDFNEIGCINTSTIEKSDNNILTGLSGRQFKIPSSWKNPSDEWHLGIISYDVICYRMKSGDEEKDYKELEKLLSKNMTQNASVDVDVDDNNQSSETLPQNQLVDCIVWFDGEKWQACICPPSSADLENIKILTNFDDGNQFNYISDNKSYCIKIQDNGNLLQIIFFLSTHATSIAMIAASHFQNESERDGMAPGAQIVSMNIHALNVSSSDICLQKAFLKGIEMGVNIISVTSDISKVPGISSLIEYVTEKHNIIVVAGAGNSGPLFSSLKKCYADFYKKIFCIGSILTVDMKPKLYNIKEENDLPVVFSYSSKGPVNSWDRGIDFVAPGAAVTALPAWCSTKNEKFFGASASVPNAVGAIACLLSALKQNSIEYSPAIIKLALSNTAYLPDGSDILGFG